MSDMDDPKCYITGRRYCLVRHHVLNGAYRDKAEADGLWVYLNDSVHKWLHDTGKGRQKMNELKADAQRKYEETHSHAEWMKRYGKNYVT